MPGFEEVDKQRLRRAIERNQAVLFLGAGFSCEATGRSGSSIPSSAALCAKLWDYLGYPGEYDNTPLKDLFHSALQSTKGHQALRYFLEDLFLVKDAPVWYDFLASVFWHRIYTTNIDTLLEHVFGRTAPAARLDLVVAPRDAYRDRDQFLGAIQYVKLHGTLAGSPAEVTFSAKQYARRAWERFDAWYFHFVTDFMTNLTIFVGTSLDEPLFLEYVEARDHRTGRQKERRPGGFLVVPRVSPARVALLEDLGLTHIPMTAQQFAEALVNECAPFPSRDEVLAAVQPTVFVAVQASKRALSGVERSSLEAFFGAFEPVGVPAKSPQHRKLYFIGQSPTWQDIAHDYDAPREINAKVMDVVQEALGGNTGTPNVIVLTGSGGCGKSTIMKRVALQLHQNGTGAYFGESDRLPSGEDFVRALRVLDKRLVIFVDAAETGHATLRDLLQSVRGIPKPPVVIIASRSNSYARWKDRYEEEATVVELRVPHLSDFDINSLLQTLEANAALGKLKGLGATDRRREIVARAGKQLLVALREATEGLGFDEIIQGEYKQLESEDAKQMYLCAALGTAAGYRLTKGELVASVQSDQLEALDLLDTALRDVVIPWGQRGEMFSVRHTLIAEVLVDEGAPREDVRAAYVALLTVLSKSLPAPRERRKSRAFKIYRHLINHAGIYRRFEKNIDDARAIFVSLETSFADDYQFWLQYGSLELEYGEGSSAMDLASLYLNQAASLAPNDDFVEISLGYLDMRKAREARSLSQATALREKGEEILLRQIEMRGNRDPYPFHIVGSQRRHWIRHWLTDKGAIKQDLEETLGLVDRGLGYHPTDENLRSLRERLQRDYFALGE